MAEEGYVIAVHSVDDWNKHFEEAKESKKLVIVDFTATWCGPCRAIAPLFAELAKKFTNVIFFKVDVDELQVVAQKWEVRAMPTFLFLREGKVVETIVGADRDLLPKKVEQLSII